MAARLLRPQGARNSRRTGSPALLTTERANDYPDRQCGHFAAIPDPQRCAGSSSGRNRSGCSVLAQSRDACQSVRHWLCQVIARWPGAQEGRGAGAGSCCPPKCTPGRTRFRSAPLTAGGHVVHQLVPVPCCCGCHRCQRRHRHRLLLLLAAAASRRVAARSRCVSPAHQPGAAAARGRALLLRNRRPQHQRRRLLVQHRIVLPAVARGREDGGAAPMVCARTAAEHGTPTNTLRQRQRGECTLGSPRGQAASWAPACSPGGARKMGSPWCTCRCTPPPGPGRAAAARGTAGWPAAGERACPPGDGIEGGGLLPGSRGNEGAPLCAGFAAFCWGGAPFPPACMQ